jgi:hypothetical protein
MSEHAGPPRFPWRVTAIIAVIVILATIVTGLLLGRDRVDPSAPTPPPPSAAATMSGAPTTSAKPTAAATATTVPSGQDRQLTVLLTVRDDERQAVSSVLLGVGGHTVSVSELFLPRALLLPTVPPMRLAQASDPNGGALALVPLQTLLGVQIDAVVDLDRLAWGGLIDATGTRVDPVIGKQTGSFGLVLDRVLAGLPPDAGTTSELLTGLGSMARTTVTNEDAGRVLALIGRGLRAHESNRALLPVTYIRAGDERTAVVKRAEADVLVEQLFPEALLQTGHSGPLRVVLQRAGSSVGAEVAARLTLTSAGMGVVADRPAGVAVDSTRVIVPDTSPAAVAAGQQVATALGLPASAVTTDPELVPVVDARVLLGPDATTTPE